MDDRVNILLVDDQPAKLLSYETILADLGENLIKAASAREALEQLLKHEIAVMLVDVCMPELDGFQLAAMIREHPRFQSTAIIFISGVQITNLDQLKGYASGAVDYISVPVVPEALRARVAVFADLYRKTAALENMNRALEQRVAERTADLERDLAERKRLEKALLEAIKAKGLRVGTDVYQNQPGTPEEAFQTPLATDGVCCSHHCGASTDQAQQAVADETVRIVTEFQKTGRFINMVNELQPA